MSMTYRPMWPFLLMYMSRNMRRIYFPQVDGLSMDTPILGHHNGVENLSSHCHMDNSY